MESTQILTPKEADHLHRSNRKLKNTMNLSCDLHMTNMNERNPKITGKNDRPDQISYWDKLLGKSQTEGMFTQLVYEPSTYDLQPKDKIIFDPLSMEDKLCLYQLWYKTLIKDFCKKYGYQFLLNRLRSLWRIYEENFN